MVVEVTGTVGIVTNLTGNLAPAAPGDNLVSLLGGLADDTYTMVFTATDNARPANQTVASVEFTLDRTPPVVTWTTPPSGGRF